MTFKLFAALHLMY